MSTTDTPIKIKQVNPIVADNIDDMADIKALVAFFDKTTEVRDVNGTVVNEQKCWKVSKGLDCICQCPKCSFYAVHGKWKMEQKNNL